MKFIDDAAVNELAKSSTILQMIVNALDFECNKYHFQPEVIGAVDNVATINCDPMTAHEIMEVCGRINSQYKRKDGKLSCVLQDMSKTFVTCRAGQLSDYSQVT